MTNTLPTSKQIERDLSQNIRAFYTQEITCPPQQITCKLFSKYIVIIANEALTPLEQSLSESGEEDLMIKVRSEIENILKPKLAKVIEDTLDITVEEILSNATFVGNTLGYLVVLAQKPAVRNSQSSAK
jgi:uncharacterized protein YbcI